MENQMKRHDKKVPKDLVEKMKDRDLCRDMIAEVCSCRLMMIIPDSYLKLLVPSIRFCLVFFLCFCFSE